MRCWITCNKRWVSGDGFSSERITWLSIRTRPPAARWRSIRQGCARLFGALICPLIHWSFYSQGWKIFRVNGSLEKHVRPPPWLLEADKLNVTGCSREGPPSNFPGAPGSRRLRVSVQGLPLLPAPAWSQLFSLSSSDVEPATITTSRSWSLAMSCWFNFHDVLWGGSIFFNSPTSQNPADSECALLLKLQIVYMALKAFNSTSPG